MQAGIRACVVLRAVPGSRYPETHLWVATAIWGLIFSFGTILYKVCLMLGGDHHSECLSVSSITAHLSHQYSSFSCAATIFLILVVSILRFIGLVFLVACAVTVILCVFENFRTSFFLASFFVLQVHQVRSQFFSTLTSLFKSRLLLF